MKLPSLEVESSHQLLQEKTRFVGSCGLPRRKATDCHCQWTPTSRVHFKHSGIIMRTWQTFALCFFRPLICSEAWVWMLKIHQFRSHVFCASGQLGGASTRICLGHHVAHAWVFTKLLRGLFSPRKLGEMIQFDEHIFQMGGSTTN